MRKLIIVLFISISTLNAQKNNCSANNSFYESGNSLGLKELGENNWAISKKGALKSSNALENEAIREIILITSNSKLLYEVIRVEKNRDDVIGVVPTVTIIFRLKNRDGSDFVSKKNAKTKLLKLKELMDLGLITKKEFDDKSECLKKILLS
tara:strand:+ start:142 stop:597 length:456 start_codon:yes stop_codon:yes gene_type:complete